jgi:hypothetical protein
MRGGTAPPDRGGYVEWGAVAGFDAGRVWRDLRNQSRSWPWVMLVSAGLTFVSLLGGDPGRRFGGPVLYFVALFGSGGLFLLAIALLVARARGGDDSPPRD